MYGSFLSRTSGERYLDEVVRVSMPILAYDAGAATWHATERARMSAVGQPGPFVDGQIAAIARTNGLVLVAANLNDFRDFAELEVEDWRS